MNKKGKPDTTYTVSHVIWEILRQTKTGKITLSRESLEKNKNVPHIVLIEKKPGNDEVTYSLPEGEKLQIEVWNNVDRSN